ncbi:MAG: MFS transporter [Dehalococcoidia bacterium]|nr:MFS transporter [Dehalococcoidia bacterium]
MTAVRRNSWSGSAFTSLRNHQFRILSAGSFGAFLAFMMSSTAQNVVAFDLTGNNRAVGFVAFGQGIAMLVFPPFGGALADRFSKRLMLLVCQGIIGLVTLVVAVLLATGDITILYLSMGAFVTGVMFSLVGPTRLALIGEIVEPAHRGNAAALTQVALASARVIGPFCAGGLLAWEAFGAAGTYFITAVIFIIVVATLSFLPPTRSRHDRAASSIGQDVVIGLRYVRDNRDVLRLVMGFFLVVTFGFSYLTVLPGFADQELHVGAAGFGTLVGVSAIGGLMVSLAFAPIADSPRGSTLLLSSSLATGISIFLLALAPGFVFALVLIFFVGGATSGFQTLNNALALRHADPLYYGRLMSLMILAWGAVGLVALPIGILADAVGERATLMAIGVTVCALVIGSEAAFARLHPAGAAEPKLGEKADLTPADRS